MTMDNIKFSTFDRYEVSKGLSAVEIYIPSTVVKFDENNTLHDIRMGAFKNLKCGTCGMDSIECSGHMGHIELYFPVLNPLFIDTTLKRILDTFCFQCHKILNKTCQCGLTKENIFHRSKVASFFDEEPPKKKKKTEIGRVTPTFIKKRNNKKDNMILFDFHSPECTKVINTRELYKYLKRIPKRVYLKRFPEFKHLTDITDSCFIHNLPVLPICTRTPNNVDGNWYPDHLSVLYSEIIKKNLQLKNKDGVIPTNLLDEYHAELQLSINTLFDVTLNKSTTSQKIIQNGGIRQRIDGKSGRIRNNLMGKRVNFSARTVLSGDPQLGINEVGVPRSIAENLTIPVTVNKYNIYTIHRYNLKYLFKKGDKEKKFDLSISKYKIEIGDVVERSLINGDIVVINRQPTLHRGSMIACYVKIFNCSTFRLNYSSMITLNADTDGDELNLHVPQDLKSRAELEELMLASTNIVCSQSNKPLIGLSQDSLLGAFKMSKTILDEQDFFDILYKSKCYKDFINTTPDILKPKRQYNGLRIVEYILEYHEVEIKHYKQEKSNFLILDNYFIEGILDKHSVGTSNNSLFHQIYLRYGHIKAAQVLHSIQLAATAYLDIVGFSVGVSDCIVEHEPLNTEELDRHIYNRLINFGEQPDEEKLIDALGKANQLKLTKIPRDNRMLDMIQSGAKGSMVKFNQMTRCIGQQFEENGFIVPKFNDGLRTLPHFCKNDLSIESKGFVKNSFIKGMNPQEFFLHAIPSRITLIDTACKTSVTGAQYRRLVKSLENAKVIEDKLGNRRVINSSTKTVIQFNYGEDDLQGEYLKKDVI